MTLIPTLLGCLGPFTPIQPKAIMLGDLCFCLHKSFKDLLNFDNFFAWKYFLFASRNVFWKTRQKAWEARRKRSKKIQEREDSEFNSFRNRNGLPFIGLMAWSLWKQQGKSKLFKTTLNKHNTSNQDKIGKLARWKYCICRSEIVPQAQSIWGQKAKRNDTDTQPMPTTHRGSPKEPAWPFTKTSFGRKM